MMKDSSDPAGEPIILPLRVDGHREPPEPGPEPDIMDEKTEAQTEEFWAGRNPAMRRSARIAA